MYPPSSGLTIKSSKKKNKHKAGSKANIFKVRNQHGAGRQQAKLCLAYS
jgi:hypothetical protein